MTGRTYSAAERADLTSAATTDPAPSREETIADFPIDALPPVLAAQARAIAEVCRVPLGMSAPMVLATASASLGRGLRVRSLPGLTTPANLYVLVCKTSGSGGSVSFKHATAPLYGIQKTLRREFETTQKPHLDAEHADLSQRIDELKRSLKGATGDDREHTIAELGARNADLAALEKRRDGRLLLVSDVTSEGLGVFLAKHNETLAHFDADAADALGTILGRYSDREHTSDTLWLKSYTGEPHIVFRKNSEPIHLDAPCLAVLFVATPDKVQELFRNARLTAGGLLPRFLACDPGARPMPLDASAADAPHTLPTDAAQPYEAAIFAAVNRYHFAPADAPTDEIDAMREAREVMREDWNRFCAASGDGDSPFEARHTENAIRLALVLHTFRRVTITQRGAGTYGAAFDAHEHALDVETMRDAVRIRDWFTAHQSALRAPQRVAVDDAAWERAEKLMRDRSPQIGITARDLYTGHRVCRDAANAARLLAQWCAEGRVLSFERKPEGAGRPTTAYRIAKAPRGG